MVERYGRGRRPCTLLGAERHYTLAAADFGAVIFLGSFGAYREDDRAWIVSHAEVRWVDAYIVGSARAEGKG
jgi:hypothetical protein